MLTRFEMLPQDGHINPLPAAGSRTTVLGQGHRDGRTPNGGFERRHGVARDDAPAAHGSCVDVRQWSSRASPHAHSQNAWQPALVVFLRPGRRWVPPRAKVRSVPVGPVARGRTGQHRWGVRGGKHGGGGGKDDDDVVWLRGATASGASARSCRKRWLPAMRLSSENACHAVARLGTVMDGVRLRHRDCARTAISGNGRAPHPHCRR